MKDNFFKLTAMLLLLLCFAATANIMGQPTGAGDELAFAAQSADTHGSAMLPTTADAPPATMYAVVEHMKVLPGKWDDYLATEKVWKKIHQQRKAKGEIMDWFLFRCLYPGGTDARYEFVTVTYYKAAKDMSAAWNFDELTKGLTMAEVVTANDAETTRHLIDRHLYSYFNGCDDACKPGQYLQLFGSKIKPGKVDEYRKFIEDLRPVRLEAIKSGKFQAWRFWERLYPANPDLDGYMAVYNYDSMEGLLKNSPFDLSAEYKKLNPTKNWEDQMKLFRELRDWTGTEMWERVDSTQ